MDNILIVNGARYVTHSALSFGDYGGYGSAGRANIDTLKDDYADDCDTGYMSAVRALPGADLYEPYSDQGRIDGTPALVVLFGSHGSEQAYLRADIADETIGALEDYPVLDEERMSLVEMEWEAEAWDSWIQSDLYRDLSEELQAKADTMHDSVLRDLYWQAMESSNTYPEAEHNSVHVALDRIIDTYADLIEAYDFGPQCLCPSLSDAQIELPL